MKTAPFIFVFGLGWTAVTIPAAVLAQAEAPRDTTTVAEN